MRVPLADGARLASLYRMGEVLTQTVEVDHHVVEVRLAPWQVEQLRKEGLVQEQAMSRAEFRIPRGA